MEHYIVYICIGFVLFLLTCYVHKHTYTREIYSGTNFNKMKRRPFPLWMMFLFFIGSMIPYLNIFLFLCGMVGYLMYLTNDENKFSFKDIDGQDYYECKSSIMQRLSKFFSVDVNDIKLKKK